MKPSVYRTGGRSIPRDLQAPERFRRPAFPEVGPPVGVRRRLAGASVRAHMGSRRWSNSKRHALCASGVDRLRNCHMGLAG